MQNHIQSEFGRIILNFTEFYKIQRGRWGLFIFLRSNFQTLLLTRRSYYIYTIYSRKSPIRNDGRIPCQHGLKGTRRSEKKVVAVAEHGAHADGARLGFRIFDGHDDDELRRQLRL
jgi:hypothetical protein